MLPTFQRRRQGAARHYTIVIGCTRRFAWKVSLCRCNWEHALSTCLKIPNQRGALMGVSAGHLWKRGVLHLGRLLLTRPTKPLMSVWGNNVALNAPVQSYNHCVPWTRLGLAASCHLVVFRANSAKKINSKSTIDSWYHRFGLHLLREKPRLPVSYLHLF